MPSSKFEGPLDFSRTSIGKMGKAKHINIVYNYEVIAKVSSKCAST